MLALIMPSEEMANELILKAKERGLILFWLLFEKKAVRITPPLTLSESEIREGCGIILEILDAIENKTNC
jgi:acetylornithine aminotransferase